MSRRLLCPSMRRWPTHRAARATFIACLRYLTENFRRACGCALGIVTRPVSLMSDLERGATEWLDLLSKEEISSEALTGGFLKAIRERDPKVRAFLHVDEAAALEQARAVDQKRKRGERIGLLAGLPVAVKDVLCVKDQPTTCGSKILQNFLPPYDAHVITCLKQADAVLLGKTNMDEFAMGSSTENSAFQITRNPWNLDCIPGGSSGGSAAAVAAGE